MSIRQFEPDFRNVVNSAKNKNVIRTPLYEHFVHINVVEEILGKKIKYLLSGGLSDQKEYFANYFNLLKNLGYDTISYEFSIHAFIQGGAGLKGTKDGIIKNMGDINAYPWREIPQKYIDKFKDRLAAMREVLPIGMKLVGGIGNGIFECVQDFTSLTGLCYLEVDDPDAFRLIFKKVGEMQYDTWTLLLESFADIFAVCRLSDDFGYKTSTLISPDTIRDYILINYKKIIEQIHSFDKPVLFHSCGKINSVMEDIINVGINAKHSNEDEIAGFADWVERYGDRIGNFGGFDMSTLCNESVQGVKRYVNDVLESIEDYKGIALGSGNQIAGYVPAANYLSMVETIREWRGE